MFDPLVTFQRGSVGVDGERREELAGRRRFFCDPTFHEAPIEKCRRITVYISRYCLISLSNGGARGIHAAWNKAFIKISCPDHSNDLIGGAIQ